MQDQPTVFAWLAAYPPWALRLQYGSSRLRCGWPDRAIVEQLLGGIGHNCLPMRNKFSSHVIQIVAIALLSRGGVHDDLSDWDEAARIQWRHLRRAGDAYSFHVRQVWQLEVPCLLSTVYKAGTDEPMPMQLAARNLVCRPVLHHPRDWATHGGQRVGDLVGSGHCRLCLVLPEPTVALVASGVWQQVVTLARAHLRHARSRRRFHNRLLPKYPPSQQLRDLRTDMVPIDSEFQLSAAGLQNISQLLQSWAPRILAVQGQEGGDWRVEQDLRGALQWLTSASDALSVAAYEGDLQCSGRFYSSMQLFNCLRLCSMLRNQSRMDIVLRRAMSVVFSGSMLQQLDVYLAQNKHVAPRKSSIARHRLTLDLAFMLLRRVVVDDPAMVRVGWIDSSPILGYDLLMSRCLEVRQNKLLECFDCVTELTRDEAAYREGDERLTDARRLELSEWLWETALVHTHAPVHMDRGKADLTHKCAALAWTWRHEASDLSALSAFQASYRFMITDMGTESGVADFRTVEGVQSMLPSWRDTGWMPDEGASGGEHALHFLPNCLRAPGMCHLLDNLNRDIDEKLPAWEWFFERLHNISCLLGSKSLCKLFVERCVLLGGRFTHERLLFEKSRVERVYEKRWGHVVGFLQRSRRHLCVMRVTWNEHAFCNGHSSTDKDFSPALLTDTLVSNKFFGVADAILKLHELPASLQAWCEGCPCHEHLLQDSRLHKRDRLLAEAFGGPGRRCPMLSMRFPELVAGRLSQLQEELGRASAADLVCDLSVALSPADLAEVLANFEAGRAAMSVGLALKTRFTQSLPHLLGALAHSDCAVASRFAALAETAWDSTPADHRNLHHRFTRLFFEDVGMRAQLGLHAKGTPLSELERKYQEAVSIFRFCPCAERVIESFHKDVKQGTGQRRPKLAYASLLLRQRELEDALDRRPADLVKFLDCFSACRNIHAAAEGLSLQRHPDLLHLRGQGLHQNYFYSVLQSIVYRSDMVTPCMDLTAHKRKHLQHRNREQRQALRAVAQRPRRSIDTVLANEFVEHFRASACDSTGGASCSYLLLPGTDPLAPLQDIDEVLGPPVRAADTTAAFDADGMPEPPASQLCLKIADAHPARKHVIPTAVVASGRLSRCAIAVSVHEVVEVANDGSHIVSQAAALCSGTGGIGIKLLDKFLLADWNLIRTTWKLCSPADGAFPCFAGATCKSSRADICTVLHRLVAAQAYPGKLTGYKCDDNTELAVLHELQDLGLFESSEAVDMELDPRPQWFLSRAGLQRLSFGVMLPLAGQRLIGDVRPGMCMADLSSYELILLLRDSGWAWQPLTRFAKATPHRIAAEPRELVWHSGATVHHSYLLALLKGPELHELHGIEEIPHHAPASTYNALLRGELPGPPAVEDAPAWGADGMVEVIHGVAAAAAPAVPGPGDAALADAAAADECSAEERSDGEEGSSSNEDESPPGEADALAAAPLPAPPAPAAPLPSVEELLGGTTHWGCFLITRKADGYQATCPWHKRSRTTACKKTVSVGGKTSCEAALARLKFWCTQAKAWTRQHEHVYLQDVSAPPADEMLEQMLHDDADLLNGPAHAVLPDNELDAPMLAGGAAAAAAAGPELLARGGPGRGRGRARRGRGRGRARCAGAGAAAAAAAGAAAAATASTSSSSSSASSTSSASSSSSSSSDSTSSRECADT